MWLPPVPVDSLPLPCASAAAGKQSTISRIKDFRFVLRCGKSRAGKESMTTSLERQPEHFKRLRIQMSRGNKRKKGERRNSYRLSPSGSISTARLDGGY